MPLIAQIDLPKFDRNRPCPKCGAEPKNINYLFCDTPKLGSLCWEREKEMELERIQDHMHRKCRECQYEWLEACLD